MIKKSVLVILISFIFILPGFTNGNDEKIKNDKTNAESEKKAPNNRKKAFYKKADVIFVQAEKQSGGSWIFDVTVSHPDSGWDNYADGWDVYLEDGTVLKPDTSSPFTRLLLHPHVAEQPFTRSQSGIVIPKGVTTVYVRAHSIVGGWGGREVKVDLKADDSNDFKVIQK